MTLEELFEEHHISLFRFLSRMTGDPELAKDMVQETFVSIAEKWSPSEPPTRAWLFQVARNLTRSDLRKRQRRLHLLRTGRHRVPSARPEPSPEVHAERVEARAALRGALDGLSEREQTIVLMREEGFTHREIAKAVDTTTGSVGTMLARALAKLEERLEEHGRTDR
jgi:RNA polymerase sigma-70 factor (ECF subfamily)